MDSAVDHLPTERLEADIAYLAVEIDRCMGRWLELIAEFDRREGARAAGFRTTAEWLAWRCSLDQRTARDHVRVARRLEEWPLMASAYSAGELSYSKLRALSRASVEEDESVLVTAARDSSTASLERLVRRLRTAPSADLDFANAVHARRYVEWAWDDDGSLRIHGRLGPEEGAAFVAALEAGAEALHPFEAPEPGRTLDGKPLEPDDPPTAAAHVKPAVVRAPLKARRADALAEIMLSGAPRAQVVLHVDQAALACTAAGAEPRQGEVCSMEDGPAVPSETARRLACDAEVVTDQGRRRRVVNPALRASLERRDGRCRFPGCTRRHGLHAHHIEHWAHGGRTDRDNLVLLCRFHHRLLHEEGFTVVVEDDRHAFRRPDGQLVPEVGPLSDLSGRAPPDEVIAA